MPLSQKQLSFISYFMELNNGTQAAIKAGYSPKTSNEQAARLLAKASVKEEVAKRKAALAKANEVTLDELVQNAKEIRDYCRQITEGKMINSRDALKSVELLAKLTGNFIEKKEMSVTQIEVTRSDSVLIANE